MKRPSLSLFALLIVCFGLLAISDSSAITYQNTTDVVFTFNPVVSLSVSGDLSINDLRPGNSADSNTITVTASSNAMGGYALYSNVGNSTYNTTELRLNGTDTTNKFTVLSSAVSSLANFGDSNWGYSYCNTTNDCTTASNWVYGSTGSTNTGYGIMPLYNDSSHTGDVKLVDTTASSATTLKYKIGAKASSSQVAGAYTNVVNFINVPKIITIDYTLNYLDNSGTATSGTLPSTSTGTTTDGTFAITTSRPTNTNTNYVFKGWCTENNSSDVTACPGAIIYPGNLYTIGNPSSTFTGNVYAVWQDNTAPVTIADATYMQDVEACPASLTTGQVYSIQDARDDQYYSVAKLADGKCWMVENLNIAGGTALSADDTNVTSAYISSFSTSNNLTKSGNTIVLPASSTSGFNTSNYSYVYNSGNKTNCGASGQNTPCYSYYSWDAATLGSGRSISTANTDAQQSICPKGWKLPSTYNGSGTAAEATDFRALMIGYGGSNSIQTYNSSTTPTGATMYGNIGPGTTPNFLLAGYYGGGSFNDVGSYGYYWSSTSYSSTSYAHYLYFYSSLVYSAGSYYRRVGVSVRCLFSGQ